MFRIKNKCQAFADVGHLQGNVSLSMVCASNGEIGLNGTWINMKHFLVTYLRQFRKIIAF